MTQERKPFLVFRGHTRDRWRQWSPWRRWATRTLAGALVACLAVALHFLWGPLGWGALLALVVLPSSGDYSDNLLDWWRTRRAQRRIRRQQRPSG